MPTRPLSRRTVVDEARVSPAGTLRVENVGADEIAGPTDRWPAFVGPVSTRWPVTATAPAGPPPRPATWSVRTVLDVNAPDSPTPVRLSSRRAGLIATKVEPDVPGTK